MKKILFHLYFLVIISYLSISAQQINVSFAYGGKVIVTKRYHYGNEYRYNSEYLILPEVYLFDIKLGIIINFEPKMNFELRMGYSYGGEDFSGLDFDMLFRHKIMSESLSVSGILNLHRNEPAAHGAQDFGYTRGGFSLNPGIGLDYLLTGWLGVEFFYIYNVQNYYGYTFHYDYGSNRYYNYKKYLYHTFKF
ncbi:MAG: hypothetical protein JW995_11465, partial [Melioribacteraceae bacterium]|nr:hypothetical protein [Melioribacteraceae bacterium]